MKPLVLWLIAICALTLAVATCGDSDDDDSSDASNDDDVDDDETDDDNDDDDSMDDDVDDDADDDTQTECDTWTDTTSGLTWLVDPAVTTPYAGLTWQEAMDYCDTLACGGHDDWRLPTVTELRSLIRGCPDTAHGGSCGVTDDCLLFDCAESGEEYPCNGCLAGDGPANGCYWPEDVRGRCDSVPMERTFWTSSLEQPVSKERAWQIEFYKGGLDPDPKEEASGNARCARGEF